MEMGIVISLKSPLTCQEAIPLPGFSMATDKSLFLPDEQAEKFKAGPALCPSALALGMPLPPPWSWHPITRVRDSLRAPLPAWPPSTSLRPRVHSRHINLVTPTADRPARRPRAVRGPTWPRMRGTKLCVPGLEFKTHHETRPPALRARFLSFFMQSQFSSLQTLLGKRAH